MPIIAQSLKAIATSGVLALFWLATPVAAQAEKAVTSTMPFPADATYRYAIDATEGERGKVNAAPRTAMYVYSMLEEDGVPRENITVAVVVHGDASFDFLKAERYAAHFGTAENPNISLVEQFLAMGGQIWMSGFGMEFREIANSDLLPGIGVAPAALVDHVELQRQGFGLHPK